MSNPYKPPKDDYKHPMDDIVPGMFASWKKLCACIAGFGILSPFALLVLFGLAVEAREVGFTRFMVSMTFAIGVPVLIFVGVLLIMYSLDKDA